MRSSGHRHGFVMLSALLVLAIVGVAIVSLATATSADGFRTLRQAQSAQLEQMLLAGAADAVEHLRGSPAKTNESWNTNLPAELASADGVLHTNVISASDDSARLRIVARLPGRSETQSLAFKRESGRWRLVSAELETRIDAYIP